MEPELQINNKNKQIFILFSYQLLQIAFVDVLDPQKHILLEQVGQATWKVIKNGRVIQQFVKNIKNTFIDQNVVFVSYSLKEYSHIMDTMSYIDKTIKWIFIGHLPQIKANKNSKLCKIRPNHCRKIDYNGHQLIGFGQKYSQSIGKQHLLIALRSIFKFHTNQLLILEPNEEQVKRLKQKNIYNIFSYIPNIQQIKHKFEKSAQNLSKQYGQDLEKIISHSPKLQSLFNGNQQQYHILQNIANQITVSLNTKYYRLSHSNSICSHVFRAVLGGKQKIQAYAKCDIPKDIGGQIYIEYQENKVLASAIYNLIDQTLSFRKINICKSLQIWLFKNGMFKSSLLKSYDKKRGCFIVRKFIKQYKQIKKLLTDDKVIQELIYKGTIKNSPVRGIGTTIALSILINQNFMQKGILEQGIYYIEGHQFVFCRTGFKDVFNFKNCSSSPQQLLLSSNPLISIKIKDMSISFFEEMKLIFKEIISIYPLIQGLFRYHAWSCQKGFQLRRFNERLEVLREIINDYNQTHMKQEPTLDIIKNNDLKYINNISEIDPRWFSYMVQDPDKRYQDNYSHFLEEDKSMNFYNSFEQFGNPAQNAYVSRAKQSGNFVIYANGNMIPTFTLCKWLKNTLNDNKNTSYLYKGSIQLHYISLLKHKPNKLQIKTKQAKMDKKNSLFVIDHCQLDNYEDTCDFASISDFCSGFKTVFIYRFKKNDSKKLKSLNDKFNNQVRLIQSQDEIFRTIFRLSQQNNIFKLYKDAIFLWVDCKCRIYGLQYEKAIKLMWKIVNYLLSQKDRLITIVSNLTAEQKLHLYALPIFIKQQRIYFSHDILQFLQIYRLTQQIYEGKSPNITGNQLRNLKQFKQYFSNDYMQTMRIKIQKILENMIITKQILYGSNQKYIDLCQILRILDAHRECQLLQILRPGNKCLSYIEHEHKILCLLMDSRIAIIKINQQKLLKSENQQVQLKSITDQLCITNQNLMNSFCRDKFVFVDAKQLSQNTISFYEYNINLNEIKFVEISVQNYNGKTIQIIKIHQSSYILLTTSAIYKISLNQNQQILKAQSIYQRKLQDNFETIKIAIHQNTIIIGWVVSTNNNIVILKITLQIGQKQLRSIQLQILKNIVNRNLKCFSLNIHKVQQQLLYLLVSCFYQNSDHLTIYQIPIEIIQHKQIIKVQQNICKFYYKVQDNPCSIAIINQQLWVGSIHGFIKRMGLPNLFDAK